MKITEQIIAIRQSMQDLSYEIGKLSRDGMEHTVTTCELKQRRDKLAASVETLKSVDSVMRVFHRQLAERVAK